MFTINVTAQRNRRSTLDVTCRLFGSKIEKFKVHLFEGWICEVLTDLNNSMPAGEPLEIMLTIAHRKSFRPDSGPN